MAGLPHLMLQGTARTEHYIYTGPIPQGPFKLPPRDGREEHGAQLREQLNGIEQDERRVTEQEITPAGPKGIPIEFRSDPKYPLKLESLEDKRAGVRLLNVRVADDKTTWATVFVPEGKTTVFGRKIEQYVAEDTKKGVPKNRELVESISEMRRAVLPSFWMDTVDKYPAENETTWFEVWLCNEDLSFDVEQAFREEAASVGIDVRARHIPFPERIVPLCFGVSSSESSFFSTSGGVPLRAGLPAFAALKALGSCLDAKQTNNVSCLSVLPSKQWPDHAPRRRCD